MKDGIDHINVFSRGETELGRLLSNFAHTPFDLNGRRFESVEGYWYWKMTGDERVSQMFGWQAKQFGRELMDRKAEGKSSLQPTPLELREVYLRKLKFHPHIRNMLLLSNLPFKHYYVFNGSVREEPRWTWTADLWAELRCELIEKLVTVDNIKNRRPGDVYGGRPGNGEDGYFGNPFPVKNGDRTGSIQQFKKYFWNRINTDEEYRRQVSNLDGKRIVCFCWPLDCHCMIFQDWLFADKPLRSKL